MSDTGRTAGGAQRTARRGLRRGPLAQVLATRGGKAPPEAPVVIEHREALIYMLCEAAELEHGIMCQYLFAAFSLKQEAGEGLSEELAAVRRWRKLISKVATGEGGRRAALAEIQGGLPAMIQPDKNGPYLVTNAQRLVSHVGETMRVTPQMALCRCGGSSMKPFCDGPHARTGFDDAKDPKRVPGRRDTYAGEQ
ncbi:MAG: CDGSH iron-sulfur domain-containing protein [Micromonosporaceae bacterium]